MGDQISKLLPFLQRNPMAGNFFAPGTSGTPNQAEIQQVLGADPALRGYQGMVTGVSPQQAPDPNAKNPLAMLAASGAFKMPSGGGGGAPPEISGGGMGMPRGGGGQPGQLPVGPPPGPPPSIGQYLLSPEGQQILAMLQNMGRSQ